jgi:hypothetical protein
MVSSATPGGNGFPDPPDLAGGLSDADREADLLARWPHLAKPGPQPCNQIGTLRDQLRKVFGPAGAPDWSGLATLCPPLPPPVPVADFPTAPDHLAEIIREEVRRILAEDLPEALDYLLARREVSHNGAAAKAHR